MTIKIKSLTALCCMLVFQACAGSLGGAENRTKADVMISDFDRLSVETRSIFSTKIKFCSGPTSVETSLEKAIRTTSVQNDLVGADRECVDFPEAMKHDRNTLDSDAVDFSNGARSENALKYFSILASEKQFDWIARNSNLFRNEESSDGQPHSLNDFAWQIRSNRFVSVVDRLRIAYGYSNKKFPIFVDNKSSFLLASTPTTNDRINITPGLLRLFYAICGSELGELVEYDDMVDLKSGLEFKSELAKRANDCLTSSSAFVFAHELGHIFLRDLDDDSVRDGELAADECAVWAIRKAGLIDALDYASVFANSIQYDPDQIYSGARRNEINERVSKLSALAANPAVAHCGDAA